jgi:hypothetical protein
MVLYVQREAVEKSALLEKRGLEKLRHGPP